VSSPGDGELGARAQLASRDLGRFALACVAPSLRQFDQIHGESHRVPVSPRVPPEPMFAGFARQILILEDLRGSHSAIRVDYEGKEPPHRKAALVLIG
jgi:hypothetical protein